MSTSLQLRLTILASALAIQASLATAQLQDGDILLNNFSVTSPTLEQLSADGTPVTTFFGPGTVWEGVVVTPSGLVGTTQGSTDELLLFDSGGTLVSSFALTNDSSGPGDLDTFLDGTFAVVDQGGEVDLYSESGVYLSSFSDTQLDHPFGCYVDAQDHLWVCDLNGVGTGSGRILEFDRQGVVQQVITTNGIEPGDLVRANDGTLWVAGRTSGMVHHLDATGASLSSFQSNVAGFFAGIALQLDGTLLLTGESDSQIHNYSTQGVELATYPAPGSGSPLFMIVVGAGHGGTPYCFGDGTSLACPCGNPGSSDEGCANSTAAGATLESAGSSSASVDTLTFSSAQLPPGEPALLFSALNAVQGGNGALFGDGLRCAGGSVKRLGVTPANSTGDAAWGPGLAAAGGWQSGEVRRFQVWYRDPVGGPCSAGFNLTNGVEIGFAP